MKSKHSLFALFVAAALSFGAVGSFVAINALAEHPAGSQVNGWANPTSTEGSYYEQARGLSGSALRAKLKSILSTGTSLSYDWTRFEACDEAQDDSSSILCIYSRKTELKTAHVSNAHVGWNREHTFPQSKMGTDTSKSDDHIVFASDCNVNGARSNYKLGIVSHTGASPVVDSYGNATECYLVDSIFEPCDAARGEVARASLYAATLYDYDLAEGFTKVLLANRPNIGLLS
jgi:endonuclease I